MSGSRPRGRIIRAVMASAVLLCVATPGKAAQLLNSFGGPSPQRRPAYRRQSAYRYSSEYPLLAQRHVPGPHGQRRPRRESRASERRPMAAMRRVKLQNAARPWVADNTYVPREVLIEIAGDPGEDQVSALSRRFRLTRVQSQNLPGLNATFFLLAAFADDRSGGRCGARTQCQRRGVIGAAQFDLPVAANARVFERGRGQATGRHAAICTGQPASARSACAVERA